MKRFNLSAWAVSHPTLVLFLMLVLGVAGFFSYQKLGRAEDPFFTVKVVNVSVLWPGATAQEMQAEVADPIEKKIQELPYFEKVQTYSKPGFTALQITFRDSTPPKDVPYLFYLVRKKLVDVQDQLPAGLLGPVVNDEVSASACSAFPASPRSTSTASRTSASLSSSATPSLPRSASRRRRCSIRLPSRTTSCRPARSRPMRSAFRSASP